MMEGDASPLFCITQQHFNAKMEPQGVLRRLQKLQNEPTGRQKLGAVIGGFVPSVMETVRVRSEGRRVGGLRGATDATVEHVQMRKA